MPHKASLPLPLREQYYAGRPDGDFTDGPYLSRESAVEEAPESMGLKPGDEFHVGVMRPFRPEIDAYRLLNFILEAAAELSPQAAAWAESVGKVAKAQSQQTDLPCNHADELEGALNLCFLGWLTHHEIHPAFGFVEEATISRHTMDGELLARLEEIVMGAKEEDAHGPLLPEPLDDAEIDPQGCPYCGSQPGDGITPGCPGCDSTVPGHPLFKRETDFSTTPPPPAAAGWEALQPDGSRTDAALACEAAGIDEPVLLVPKQEPERWRRFAMPTRTVYHCGFVRADGKRCHFSSSKAEGEEHEHQYFCGKPVPAGFDDPSDTCDRPEGHEGDCRACPF